MDNARHRQILRVLRPHGADRLDPAAQVALTAARGDAALGHWFEREQAFDRGFAERIQTITAPAHLREAIFASVQQARGPQPARERRTWLVQRPFATGLAALAAAASLALLAIVLWPRQARTLDLESAIAAAASASEDVLATRNLAGSPLTEVRDWLAARSAPVPGEIPAALAALPAGGVGIVELGGVTSSVVIFEAAGRVDSGSPLAAAHRLALFTLPRQSCSTAGITREPSVREEAGRAIAVWRDATSVYVLTVDASADALRDFLAGGRLVTATDPPNDRTISGSAPSPGPA